MKIARRLIAHFFGSFFLRELDFARQNYHFSVKKVRPCVVYNHDGRFNDNGLADKIRGMVSAYAFAKATGLRFYINHQQPFVLQDYFIPNKIDWTICENDVSYCWLQTWPIIILDYEKGEQLAVHKKKKQYHFYSNVNFIHVVNLIYNKNYCFSTLFSELFKPSKLLLEIISQYEDKILNGYISISFRFMQLMGDFMDVRGETLSSNDQEQICNKCIDLIEQLHKDNQTYCSVFVTSDSCNFMRHLDGLDYVFYIPGEISHLGFQATKAACLKTFADYYMISKAKKAFLGVTGDMYNSNFARSAAESSDIPFEAVHF